MLIMFGWQKETKPLGAVGTIFCYDCRRESRFIAWNESEWVTLFMIRALRFINKHHLHCDGCSATFTLQPAEFREIDTHMRKHDSINGTPIHAALIKRIETEQLASKTPLQIQFIRESMKAQREYQEAIKTQEGRSQS